MFFTYYSHFVISFGNLIEGIKTMKDSRFAYYLFNRVSLFL